MPRRAWRLGLGLALGGMLACQQLPVVTLDATGLLLDRAWLAVEQGDIQALARAGAELQQLPQAEPALVELLHLEGVRLSRGRAAALVEARDDESAWAARYMASDREALRWLGERAPAGPSSWSLERAARASSGARQRSLARQALLAGPDPAGALALLVEVQVASGETASVARLLDGAPDTARLAWVRRRHELLSGRPLTAAAGLLTDLRAGRITPRGLGTLESVLVALHDEALEQQTRDALTAWQPAEGSAVAAAAAALEARLWARQGVWLRALASPELASADDDGRRQRWRAQAAIEAGHPLPGPSSPEQGIDGDLRRATGRQRARLATCREWSLAARAQYEAFDRGAGPGLEAFLAALDQAATGVPGAPVLADLPRRDFGMFGTLLDPTPLAAADDTSFVLGGQGLFQPAELTVYDLLERVPMRVGDVRYHEHHVARQRVPGYVASRGSAFTGAGIVDSVFLDLDLVRAEAARLSALGEPADLPPFAAADTAARRSLAEPLDVARLLWSSAVRDAGDALEQRLLESLSLHEGQHILDAQDFLGRGLFGRLGMLVDGGLTPGAVRAALERRAQLRALRESSDPRFALADCVARVPVEGQRLESEHALGYATLLADFIEVLDRGEWPGARPLDELGLERGANLLQQLHRLSPEVVRALARAVAD